MEYIVGIDEVGRGPVAGPVTVCVFIVKRDYDLLKYFKNRELKDSKKLSDKIRREIRAEFNKAKLRGDLDFVLISKSASYIDKNGISKSVSKCIEEGLFKLCKLNYNLDKKHATLHLDGALKIEKSFIDEIKNSFGYVLKYDVNIKGDEKIPVIACASIMAKVTRDNYMIYIGKKLYDEEGWWYNWQSNMGYGTKEHYLLIKKHGITELHRKSFLKQFN